VCK
ncbi:DNA topoisomerase 1, partial [Haemophilus influenzae]|jgi:hypothetical protein